MSVRREVPDTMIRPRRPSPVAAIPPPRVPPAARPGGAALAAALLASLLAGCGTFYQDSSPDVVYSRDATAARALQVPPDLTDVSDGEQFVLPGTEGGALTRDTLLPTFENVRLVRDGDAAWLAFDETPEELWPRLLAFARKEKYRIEATEPTAGTLYTQWRPASAVREGSLLGNLIGGEDYTRLGFRLERRPDGGSRLFVRRQEASESVATGTAPVPWPEDAGDPDVTGALLARLLVFLGVAEQRARGILDAERAASVLEDAVVSTGPAGSLLVVNRGYEPAFRAVGDALGALERDVTARDDGVGRIEYADGDARYVLTLVPVHVGAVRVTLSDADGRRLPSERERESLETLAEALVASPAD